MRNFILGFLVASLVFGTVAIANEFRVERAGFDILVNGEEFKSDPPPVVIDGRTFLPLRAMGDALNTRVHWNGEERRVEVGKMPQVLTDVIVSDGLQIKPIGRKELDGHYTVVVEVTADYDSSSSAPGEVVFDEGEEFTLTWTSDDGASSATLRTIELADDVIVADN